MKCAKSVSKVHTGVGSMATPFFSIGIKSKTFKLFFQEGNGDEEGIVCVAGYSTGSVFELCACR